MFGIPSPYLIGGTALAFVVAVGAAEIHGQSRGYDSAETKYKLQISQMVIDAKEAAEKSRRAMQSQADAALTTLETQNAKARVIYRTINHDVDKIVERAVYRQVCLDDQGVTLANAALAGVSVALPMPLPGLTSEPQ